VISLVLSRGQRLITQFRFSIRRKAPSTRLQFMRSVQVNSVDAFEGVVQAGCHAVQNLRNRSNSSLLCVRGKLIAEIVFVVCAPRGVSAASGREGFAHQPPAAANAQQYRW